MGKHPKKQNQDFLIFVSGAGEDNATWGDVQPELSKHFFTLSYDRIGLGKSDSLLNYHKDASSMATELSDIIEALKISGPLIVVGHSIGCQVTRIFAAQHPELVSGILFIDPGFSESGLKHIMPDSLWKARIAAIKSYLPPNITRAQLEELKEISHSCDQAEKAIVAKNAKVVLLTATKITPGFPGAEYESRYKKFSHERWRKEIPQTIHEFVSQSRHYIQYDAPNSIYYGLKIHRLKYN